MLSTVHNKLSILMGSLYVAGIFILFYYENSMKLSCDMGLNILQIINISSQPMRNLIFCIINCPYMARIKFCICKT